MKIKWSKLVTLIFIYCFYSNVAYSQVVINEVMHYPSGAQGIISGGTEYVELFNTSPCTSANIGCWIIGIADVDGIANNRGSIVLPATASIPPLGHYVIGTTSSSADTNSIDFKTNRNTSNYCATGSFILANGDGWVGLYDATGIPVDALYWTVSAGEASKITTDGDLDDSPCVTTTAPGCPAVASLLSPENIFLTYPTRISYGGQYVNANTFSRIPDGGTWTRAIAPSINDLTVGNCNGGAGACIVPSGALRDTFDISICNGQSYLFNGINRTSTGFYLDTFPRSGGCDSIAVLNLIIKPSRSGSISTSICLGSSYLFNGINRATAGAYLDTLVGSNGCDSFLTLNLSIRPTTSGSISASICLGSSYLFNGINRATAGAYLDTLVGSNGCDSFLTLNLSIRPTTSGSISASICLGSSYLFNGINRTIAGVYLDTLVGSSGCDSILTLNLSLRVRDSIIVNQNICAGSGYLFNGVIRNSSGTYLDTLNNIYGCDSLVTLILSIGSYSSGTINTSICNGNAYFFNGINRTTAGSYNDTLLTSTGTCDSIVTLNLSLLSQSVGNITQNICTGSSYLFNGINRTTAGTYLDTLLGSNGCDSFLTLNLSLRPTTTGSISASICTGSSYLFNGINRTTAGAYLDTLVGSNGCDSILTLNLSIRPTTAGAISAAICAGSSYLFNGINRTTAGAYLDTLVGSNGCDSFLTLNLSLRPTTTGSISASICTGSSYLFNGINRTTTGAYLDTLVGSNGCDSILTLNLSIQPTNRGSISASICSGSSYLFNGINRTTTGTYLDTLVGSNGCDSILTLNLTLLPTSTSSTSVFICEGASYLFNGINVSLPGAYTDTFIGINGCDSILTLNLRYYIKDTTILTQNICIGSSYLFNGINRTTSGVYKDTLTNRNGCDSLITLILTLNNLDTTISTRDICIGEAINSIYYTNDTTIINNYTNRFGCDSFYQLTINVSPLPNINAGNDTSIYEGNTAMLVAYGAANYSWNNGTVGATNSVSPITTTTYIVTGTDINNCSNIDSVIVNVLPFDDSVYMIIPSAFTPNGDGLNDIFKVLATKNYTLLSFTIFNRWGELVFKSTDINTGWDGKFKERDQPIGTYVYYIEGLKNSTKKNHNYTGTVTLIR